MPFIEAPTTFYMGRRYDPSSKSLVDEVVYYDSRDLSTHAVVVGMTGSGKTGLCISLLEEAVLDNIPAIVIDPKGDITNLLLAFPNLQPEDFAPWVNAEDARRAGLEINEYAKDVAQQWRDGLASWSIVPQRIAAMKNAAQFTIYTPGSDAGLPVSIMDSLRAPREGWAGYEETNRERISGIVTALMALIGKSVEPVRDREHVLISNIFENAWKAGQDLTLEDIILQVQKPPFAKLGVFDVDTFFPEKDRFKLALELNRIIAAPSFQSWINGEPMDISHLFYTAEGRPRVSIFYIAHLSDAERTFMITLLLENMLAWMRTLSGTTSLRGLLYFDEIFGYFPPAPRNPPTKEPLLRLLKQARAFGIGVILATQNPGDLDYKGLSNAGTWWIGKLQTEQDQKRVMAGLQTVATADTKMNVDNLGKLISNLDPRVFIMQNIHDGGGPILMHTRWTMSYLRGPLTRQEVRTLMEPQRRALGLQTAAPGAIVTPGQAAYVDRQAVAPPTAPASSPTAAQPPYTPQMTPPPQPASVPGAARAAAEPPASLPGGIPVPPSLPEAPSSPAPRFTPPPTPDLPDMPVARPTPPPTAAAVPSTPATPARTFGNPFGPVTPPATPAPISTAGVSAPPPSTSQPSQPSRGTNLTQQGPQLPDGFSDKRIGLPSTVAQFFLPTLITTQQAIRDWEKKFGYDASSFGGAQLLYKPVLLAQVVARFLDRKTNVEEDQRWAFHVPNLDKAGLVAWSECQVSPIDPKQVSGEPFGDAYYGTVSSGLTDSKRMTALKAEVVDYVYRSGSLGIYYNSTLDLYGGSHDNRRDYLLKLQQKAREARDAEIDTTTQKYDATLQKLDEKLRKEMRELTYDKQMAEQMKREDLYTTGEAVLGMLRGRTSYTLSRMSRTRRYKTQAQERAVVTQQSVADLESQIESKQQELQRVLKEVNDKWSKVATTVEEVKLTPYKKDITLEIFGLGWIPTWYIVLNGQPMMLPAFATART